MSEFTVSNNMIVQTYLQNDFTYDQLEDYIKSAYGSASITRSRIYKAINDRNLPEDVKKQIEEKKVEASLKGFGRRISTPFTEEEITYFKTRVKKEYFDILTSSDLLMLRCVRLFLEGKNYDFISKQMHVDRSTISKQLRKKKLKEYLTSSYYMLFENAFRNQQVAFSPQKEKCHVVKEPESKEKLAKTTYYRYKNLSDQTTDLKKSEFTLAELENMRKNLQKGRFDTVTKKRMATIVLSLFDLKEKNYVNLEKTTGIEQMNLIYYLHNIDLMKEIFNKEFIEKLNELVDQLDQEMRYQSEKKERSEQFKFYDKLISTFLDNYYTDSEYLPILGFSGRINSLLQSPFIKENYGEEVLSLIQQKNAIIRNCCRSNGASKIHVDKVFISSKEKFQYLIPGNFHLKRYQEKLLNVLVAYFNCYGNIEKTRNLLNTNGESYTFNSVLASLQTKELKEILNEDAKEKLRRLLKLEEKMQSPRRSSKPFLIENILTLFFVYNGNFDKIVTSFGVQDDELFRILTDDLVKQKVGNEFYEQIIKMIKEYEDKKYVVAELKKVKEKNPIHL